MKTSLGLVLAAAVVLAGCQAAAEPTASTVDLTVEELASRLESKDFLFVNTHIPYEGEIADTDAFIPYDEIDRHLDQLPADRDAEIVLYCRSGRMSSIAAEVLIGMGYTRVYNLEGGMIAWEQAGLPLLGR